MFGRQQHDDHGIPGLPGLGTFSQPTEPTAKVTPQPPTQSGDRVRSPRTAIRKSAGWVLMLGSMAVAGWLIFTLADFGTCSTGGPYVVERECAPGTGLKTGGIFVAVILAMIGTGMAGSWRAAAAAWGITFTGGAGIFFYFGFTDSILAWSFIPVGVLFLLMGLPGIWAWLRPPSGREKRQTQIYGAYGARVSVDAPEDGGPAPIVMAAGSGAPVGWPAPPAGR